MGTAIAPTSPTAVGYKLGTAAEPPEHLGGATVPVSSNLQAALGGPDGKQGPTPALNPDGTHRGNTYVIQAGANVGPIVLPQAGAGWTRLRTSGQLPARGTIVTESGQAQGFVVQARNEINAHAMTASGVPGYTTEGWHFIGGNFRPASDQTSHYNMINLDGTYEFPDGRKVLGKISRMIFERCWSRPFNATQRSMLRGMWCCDCNDLQVWDSLLEGRDIGALSDAQAWVSRRGNRLHVEHNTLMGTDENIILGDQNSGSPSNDVTILRNHLYKPIKWSQFLWDGVTPNPQWDGIPWSVKNLFEMKMARRVLFEGNFGENNWPKSQPGDAIVQNAGNHTCDDIMIRNNKIVNSPACVAINNAWGTGINDARVAVLNNLFLGATARGFKILHGCDDLWIEHNTMVALRGDVSSVDSPRTAFIIAEFPPNSYPRLTIRRNVFGRSLYGMFVDAPIPDKDWRENVQFDERAGYADSYPADYGIKTYPKAVNAGVDIMTGILASSSPLRLGNAGYYGTDGKDIGVDFAALNVAMSGTGGTFSRLTPTGVILSRR